MNYNFGFITVRTQSSRLPSKCLLEVFGKKIIENVIDRALSSGITPIICTTNNPSDDILIDIAEFKKIKFFRGSEKNKLKRWFDCANFFSIDKFHTIDADDPFFDPDLIKKSLSMLEMNYDLIKPSNYSSNGGGSLGYSIRKDILQSAIQLTHDFTDTEMIEEFLDFNQFTSTIIEEEVDLDYQIRLTLDYEEDFQLISLLIKNLGFNPSRKEIISFFKKNPEIYKINFFRNQEWKTRQIESKKSRKIF